MHGIRNGTLDEVLEVHRQIPELSPPRGLAHYRDKIGGSAHLILIAEANGAPKTMPFAGMYAKLVQCRQD